MTVRASSGRARHAPHASSWLLHVAQIPAQKQWLRHWKGEARDDTVLVPHEGWPMHMREVRRRRRT